MIQPPQPLDDTNSIKMPFTGLLMSYGQAHYSRPYHFDTSSFHWSLWRLFETYHRIIAACLQGPHGVSKPFIDGDIEHFIMRYRIVLNDLAYILRQLYPKNERGMPAPKGGVHPLEKELSITALLAYTKKHPSKYSDLTLLLEKNSDWITKMNQERDGVIHYKKRVFVVYPPDQMPLMSIVSFKYFDETIVEKTSEGGERLKSVPVFDFVNGQMVALMKFINDDLVQFIKDFAERNGHKIGDAFPGDGTRTTSAGVPLFLHVNSKSVPPKAP